MEIVIIIIAVIVYIIAGFILITNDSTSFFVKLLFAPVYILLFIGMAFFGIADLIGDIKEKQRMKDPEYAEEKRMRLEQLRQEREKREKEEKEKERIRKAKEQEEIELKEKREKEEIEKRISYFENSEATKEIVEYIKSFSDSPEKIVIYHNCIVFYYSDNTQKYDFLAHKTKNLTFPFRIRAHEYHKTVQNNNDAYFLAVAINSNFNNSYSIIDICSIVSDSYDELMGQLTYLKLDRIELTCKLKSF